VYGGPASAVTWKVNAALQSRVSASAMSTAGGGVAEGFRRWRQYGGYGGTLALAVSWTQAGSVKVVLSCLTHQKVRPEDKFA